MNFNFIITEKQDRLNLEQLTKVWASVPEEVKQAARNQKVKYLFVTEQKQFINTCLQ